MKIFVDTSAFYASISALDSNHKIACQTLEHFKKSGALLVTTNYVLIECASLVQRRHGFGPAKIFIDEILGSFEILWINEELQAKSIDYWKKSQIRGLSLVDCSSFASMKSAGIHKAMAFDQDFHQKGFEIIP